VNGGYTGVAKTCTSENCNFSYEEIRGKLYDYSHGGPYTVTLIAYGGGTSTSETNTFTVDNAPIVSVTSPTGIVTSPFNITGTATFKPIMSTTKGTIAVYINNGYIGSKSCASETCDYSYQEITDRLFSMPLGGPHTVKMVASGGGASTSDLKYFFVEGEPILPALGSPCE
jgi:hypothetical protein